MPKFIKRKGNQADLAFHPKKGKYFTRLRGMKDILPDEYKYWSLVIKKASELSKTYSYRRIDTPVLEPQEMYERSTGKSSDIVTKEMFAFIDKNEEKRRRKKERIF